MTIKLKRIEAGKYETEDGRFEIGKDFIERECYEAHPCRVSDTQRDHLARGVDYLVPVDAQLAIRQGEKGYYCPGGEEHSELYWYVWDNEKGSGDGDYVSGCEPAQNVTTKKDAVYNLEYHLREEAKTAERKRLEELENA